MADVFRGPMAVLCESKDSRCLPEPVLVSCVGVTGFSLSRASILTS